MITRRFRSSVDKHHVSPASLTLVMFIYDQGFKFLSLGLASAGASAQPRTKRRLSRP